MSTLDKKNRYFNRELSWLEFNFRILSQIQLHSTKVLEKIKFHSIFSKNLDEFFMIRIAHLKNMLKKGLLTYDSPDYMKIDELLKKIHIKCQEHLKFKHTIFKNTIIPALNKESIFIRQFKELNEENKKKIEEYYCDNIEPILTPLSVDPSHPFPFLQNGKIYITIEFENNLSKQSQENLNLGFIEVPKKLNRLIPIFENKDYFEFILLEDLIRNKLGNLFLGEKIKSTCLIRITRSCDYNIVKECISDLIETISEEIKNRTHHSSVRLEHCLDTSNTIKKKLQNILKLSPEEIYSSEEILAPQDLISLYELPLAHLKEKSFNPRLPSRLASTKNIFEIIQEKDLLVHHPYESFYTVVEFLNDAATDPNVFTIKQTLYRFSKDSPIISSLLKAAQNGKQVTIIVELTARFDEKNNIKLARTLEKSGINIVYGFISLKTHCKISLVIRKHQKSLQYFTHLSTGNYHFETARQYTDISLFTANKTIGKNANSLFNFLTGSNILNQGIGKQKTKAIPNCESLIISPFHLRIFISNKINNLIEEHKKTQDGMIIAKMNALVDKKIIENLYQASQAGVKIRLIIRGICCLRPGVKGLSENIEVISILDRFLEHSRINYFTVGGKNEVFLSSADWMPRSMDRRIEILYPVNDLDLKNRIIYEILETCWNDNETSSKLQSNGQYIKRDQKTEKKFRAQEIFIELARQSGLKSLPYEKAIHYNHKKKGGRPILESSLSIKPPSYKHD